MACKVAVLKILQKVIDPGEAQQLGAAARCPGGILAEFLAEPWRNLGRTNAEPTQNPRSLTVSQQEAPWSPAGQ